ncbi:MAG: hypothetical protein WDO24_23135 [Pseudomonadota bacterium]
MPVSAITPIAPPASLALGPSDAVTSVVTTTNADGTTTITTTYADGTSSTATEPSPRSSLVTKEVTIATAHGTISNTVSYADGTTKTTTTMEADHAPSATDLLAPHNAAQLNLLLAVQENTQSL